MAGVVEVILGVGTSLLAAEIVAKAPAVTSWLIRHAVRRLPDHDQDRFSEEWLAHAADLPGSISKIRHGLACYLKASRAIKRARSSSDALRRRTALLASGYIWVRTVRIWLPFMVTILLRGDFNRARAYRVSINILVKTLVFEVVYRKASSQQALAAVQAAFEKLKTILLTSDAEPTNTE
jgi:hypothetical protein